MPRHLLIGGLFTRIDGTLCTANLEVLDALTGARVSGEAGAGFNGPVTALALDEDGIYVAGCFTEYNGESVPSGLIRLNYDLTRDTAFAPPDFYVEVASPYPVPTQILVSGDYVFAVASDTYTTFQKDVKDRRVFAFPTNHFGTSLQDGAYWGPQIVRFSKSTGALDTSWKTDQWVWNEADSLDRWVLRAASAHTSGAIIVSVGQDNGMASAGALLLLDADDCSVLHAIDSTVAAPGFASGVAVDVTTLPNSDVVIIHQDAANSAAWTFRDSGLNVFDPIAKQGAMFHVLQVVDAKFLVDTGFTAASLWEFQVGGEDKYGLADLPIRLHKELLKTSPIVTTIPFPGGDDDYFGKWGTNDPGTQVGMVFWHGDPADPTRCWDTHNGTYVPASWSLNGFYCETGTYGEAWNDTVTAYPLAVLGSSLESMDDGDIEPGVGVYVCGPVKLFKNVAMKGLCNTQTLSIDGGSINQADFQYYPFFKVDALGAMVTGFTQHLFEYQEADADQLSGLDFGIDIRLHCGRVLCAMVLPAPSTEETTLFPHPPNWTHPVEWQRRWESEIADTLTGAEERAAWRGHPLRQLSFTVTPADLDERIQLEERLLAALKSGRAAVPHWGRSSVLAADATAASLTVTIEVTAWPWAIGDWIFFMDDQRRWDLVQLANVSDTTLTLENALARTYPKGSPVWPVLYGKLTVEDMSVLTNHQGEIGLSLIESDPSTSRLETSCPVVTNYLGRPVFPFPLNWADGITKRFQFDLRELLVGFGKSIFAPTQSHVTQGFESSVWLRTDTEIKAFDCFTQALSGRLKGFWLQSPLAGLEMLEMGAFNDRFYIRDIGLADSWQLHPDQYLCFTYPADTPRYARIQDVQDLGDGREFVILDSEQDIDAGWEVSRLHYVRLADDVERARFVAENWQSRKLRVIELPHEYAAAETGQQPVVLYRFWMETPGGAQSWFFTSYGENVTSNSQIYTAKPITHGEIRRSTRSDREEVRIEAVRESDHPLALLWPFRLALPLWVEIKEATLAAPDATTTVFLGQVDRAPVTGRKITASCASLLDALGAQAMRFLIGPKCNHKVYAPACGVTQASFEVTVTIATLSADRLTVRVSGAGLSGKPANWFADGWIQTGTGAAFQYATVLESAAVTDTTHELKLNWPLHTAALSDAAKVVAGCDGKFATCGTKFSNQVNFGGHPRVPIDNPSLPSIPLSSGGGKK